ncbi:FAD-dependent oxidoreductase [Yoonia sp. SS1-5]|uniref:NAD(P)/FAD-dependent oxidoreductase n=1 Tax=Yoonia rhodophyticola TaxID=3137370 RepID=A0AAN0MCS4_9RHOB
MTHTKKVAVIGAGIVGVATAIWLQRDGYQVTLIDKQGPAAGTSFGNGGVLASCAAVPVTGPGLIRKAPRMLLDPAQPLFLKWRYLPRLLPWLTRYLRHANAADTRRIAKAIAGVTTDSLAEHQSLADGTIAARWIIPSDYIYAYKDQAAFAADSFAWDIRQALGFRWDLWDSAAFSAYDPVFSPDLGFAVCMGNHGRIADPGAYVKDLARHFERQGGTLHIGAVTDILRTAGDVSGVQVDGTVIPCDIAVLTAGVWSKTLAAALGLHIPMETERGYHLDLWAPSVMPKAPVMIAGGKFVATPMDGRLRLAGIVEFGGLDAAPSRPPFALLKRNIRKAIPGLTWDHATEWMGHRPAPADSIPVIGEVPGIKGVYAGFGHHHIGLTSGPKTGRLLAQIVAGKKPNLDLSAYSPARYASDGQQDPDVKLGD